jgi:uncharacterized protein YdeI (YjbR/CyaY-like superfamily)
MKEDEVVVNVAEISNEEKALKELLEKIDDLNQVASSLLQLRQERLFQFLSKKTRVEMIRSLLDHADAIVDSAKSSFNALKKNKRVRVPDELTDMLIRENRLGALTVAAMSTAAPAANGDDDDDSV